MHAIGEIKHDCLHVELYSPNPLDREVGGVI